MGFDDYFLIVWDLLRFGRSQGYYMGMGRGSAVGSLVAYALGITGIDPVEKNLLFERFLMWSATPCRILILTSAMSGVRKSLTM